MGLTIGECAPNNNRKITSGSATLNIMTNRHLYFKHNNGGVRRRVCRQFRFFITCIIKTVRLNRLFKILFFVQDFYFPAS